MVSGMPDGTIGAEKQNAAISVGTLTEMDGSRGFTDGCGR